MDRRDFLKYSASAVATVLLSQEAAADDSVMPTTKEAIAHAQAAGDKDRFEQDVMNL